MSLVISGYCKLPGELGASETTVKIHRSQPNEKDAGSILASARQNGGQTENPSDSRFCAVDSSSPDYR
jgi:hypothetical protein